jgi:predicted Zn-dependent protease
VQHAADIDAGALAKTAIEKGTASAKPRPLEPGHYTVVFEPAAVAELLTFLVNALDARRADEGRSFFAKAGGGNRLGEKMLADAVTLESNPFDPETAGAPFDGDGLPLAPTKWFDRGTLSALRYSRYWAAQKGVKPTGFHATVKLWGGTAARQEDLYTGVKKGLLVTRFWYTRWLDPKAMLITGLTRDGVFLIEDGKVTAPVQNFRFNESPINMLKNVDAMTQRTWRMPGNGIWRVPALRTNDFNMASVSAAV